MRNVMRMRPVMFAGAAALLALSLFQLLSQAAAPTFANPAFDQQWHAAESVVPNFWGGSVSGGLQEAYVEGTVNGQTGQRMVQYFDKARMELTNPSATVTNGLLTVELISGKRQVGDTSFISYRPSDAPVAGDPGDSFLTYRSLSSLPAKVAQDTASVSRTFNPDRSFGTDATLGNDPNAAFGSYQSDPGGQYGHNIPAGMWTYLQGLPVAWLGVMGYPITEAFWARVKVGGVMKPVLVQAYQRRVLTYTPGNPQGSVVEMGNIGQHYYQWRYVTAPDGSNVTASPAASPSPTASGTATSPAPSGSPTSGTAVTIVAAPNAHPASATYITIKTTPGASCTIDWKAPGATTSERAGKTMTADKDGMVTWFYAAGGNEKNPSSKGQGTVTVTCNGASASQTVTIG